MNSSEVPSSGIHRDSFDSLMRLAEGDIGFLDKVLNAFYLSGSDLIEQMKTSWNQGDYATCANGAHALKSTSHSLGAHALSCLCRQVELAASNMTPETFATMREEFSANCAELKRIREKIS